MFWKWDKIPSTLYFTVTTVKIHKNFGDEFELSWARGDNSGTSQKLLPDKQGILHFDEKFECPCTIYRSKKDRSIRPKNVKFVLKRYTSKTEHKIYGKLTVDVGQYFNTTDATTVEIEMESGRSHAPVINIVFSFKPIENIPESQKQTDEQDMSFIGDTPERQVNLDEWDKTDIDPELEPYEKGDSQLAAFQKDKKKRKHKHKKHAEGEKPEGGEEEKKENGESSNQPSSNDDIKAETVEKKEGEEEEKNENKEQPPKEEDKEGEQVPKVIIPDVENGDEKKEEEGTKEQTSEEEPKKQEGEEAHNEEENKHEPKEEELSEINRKDEE